MAIRAVSAIKLLPAKILNNDGVKPMKYKGKVTFWELRVKSGSNICRFFYTLERPNIVIIHGFTKKTQKTDDKDIQQGLRNLADYRENGKAVSIDELF